MTRIIATLSWYQEPVPWLAELVSSMARFGVDHVVALDGAYVLYPNCQARSEGDQADVIRRAAVGAGMGATISVPRTPWIGNEVEKRDRLFALAHAVAEPGDWFWVCDGDEVIEAMPPDIHAQLSALEEDVANVTLRVQPEPYAESEFFPMRKLFRAGRDPIHVVGRHDRYVSSTGTLWGRNWDDESDVLVPCADIPGTSVYHRIHQRPPVRVLQRAKYYANRDEAGAEA